MNPENLIRPDLKNFESYSMAKAKLPTQEEIILDANESPFGEPYSRYPDPNHFDLRKKLGECLDLPINSIFMGSGSDECIDLILRLFLLPNQGYLAIPKETYGMYKIQAQIQGLNLFQFELDENFQLPKLPPEDVIKSKLCILCSPNNPTGNQFSLETIENWLKLMNGVLVVDEAYIEFSSGNSVLELRKDYPNLIIIRTLSKAFASAGIRLGYALGNPYLIEKLYSIKLPYNLSSLSQREGLKIIDGIPDFQKKIQIILQERAKLESFLNSIPQVIKVWSSQANFLLVEFQRAPDLQGFLKTQGIRIRDRSEIRANALRISIGTPQQNQKLMTLLKSFYCEESTVY